MIKQFPTPQDLFNAVMQETLPNNEIKGQIINKADKVISVPQKMFLEMREGTKIHVEPSDTIRLLNSLSASDRLQLLLGSHLLYELPLPSGWVYIYKPLTFWEKARTMVMGIFS